MAVFLLVTFTLITIVGVLTLLVRGTDQFVRGIDALLRSCISLRHTWWAFRNDSPGAPAQIEPPVDPVGDPLKSIPDAVEALQAAEVSARPGEGAAVDGTDRSRHVS
jgi:hypothetical protein